MKFDAEHLRKEQLSHKIGEQIKFYRNQLGISQAELSRRCDKDKQHIELIENGKISPNIYTIYIKFQEKYIHNLCVFVSFF